MNDFLKGTEDDVATVFCNEEEFGTEALWTDRDGITHPPLPCTFGDPYLPLEVGDPVQSDNPRAIAPTVYVKDCRPGEVFTVEGIAHEILENHPSGSGASVLILSRDPAPRPKPVPVPINRALQ